MKVMGHAGVMVAGDVERQIPDGVQIGVMKLLDPRQLKSMSLILVKVRLELKPGSLL